MLGEGLGQGHVSRLEGDQAAAAARLAHVQLVPRVARQTGVVDLVDERVRLHRDRVRLRRRLRVRVRLRLRVRVGDRVKVRVRVRARIGIQGKGQREGQR